MSGASSGATIKDQKDKIIETIATITEGLLAKDGELATLIEQKQKSMVAAATEATQVAKQAAAEAKNELETANSQLAQAAEEKEKITKQKDEECGQYIEEIGNHLVKLNVSAGFPKTKAKLGKQGGKSVKGGKKMKKAKKSRARRKGKK